MHKKITAKNSITFKQLSHIDRLLHKSLRELLELSDQALRLKREKILLALRGINGVIAMKRQEVKL